MLLDGAEVAFRSPREALEHGVAAIAQEPSVVPRLTVAENVLPGGRAERRRFHPAAGSLRDAYSALAAYGRLRTPGRSVRGPAAHVGAAEGRDPARPLARRAADRDGRADGGARRARGASSCTRSSGSSPPSGKTIILISHFLREVLELADTVTVLRDGRLVKTSPTATESETSLVEAMLGRPLTSTFPPRQPPPADAPVVLSVRGLRAPGVERVDFELRAGEILGLAGLVGAGRTELARAIYGAAPSRPSGEVVLADGTRAWAAARAGASARASR